jgi:hypothetical protein
MKTLSLLILAFGFSFLSFESGAQAASSLKVETQSFQETIPRNGTRIPFLTIFATVTTEPVQIHEIVVRRTGLSSNESLGRVWAQVGYFFRSNRTSFDKNDIATLKFRQPLTLSQGRTEVIQILANMNNSNRGETIGIILEDIVSSESSSQPKVKVSNFNRPTAFSSLSRPAITTGKRNFRIRCKNRRCWKIPKQQINLSNRLTE